VRQLIIFTLIGFTFAFAGESRFGLVTNSLGKLDTHYGAAGSGRNFSIALRDSLQINFRNFSTSTDISRATFTINAGYNAIWGDNNISKNFIDDANFSGAFLGIPLMEKKMSLVASVTPYTSLEQRIENRTTFEGQPVVENLVVRGGIARTNLNLAYKFSDQLSVAAGYEFTFGRISEDIVYDIEDDLDSQVEFSYDNQVRGQGILLSAYYRPFDRLHLGFAVRPPVLGTFSRMGNTGSNELDLEKEVDLLLPAEYSLGLVYELSEFYALGTDMIYQGWKKGYELDNQSVSNHNDYFRLGVGLERKATDRRFVNYGEQISYRAGLYYSALAQTFNNKTVNEYGFSVGVSLPVQRFRSKVDIALIAGRRGDAGAVGLEETFLGIGFSISANETWFVNIED